MSTSKPSNLPKQAIPVQRGSLATGMIKQTEGIEISGLVDLLVDMLSKK
jgi:hypothetical protein